MRRDKMQLNRNAKIVLIACGSFNPPTILHLRMFERARDFLRERGWTCVAGILSPVADNFAKPELIAAPKRLRMCELAVETSDWLRASGWECAKTHWSRTLDVLDHHKEEVEEEFGPDAHLMMICGADLLDSFNTIKPDGSRLWELEHLKRILRDYGVVVLERENAVPEETLRKLPLDEKQNVMIVRDETFPNQLSSTRLRAALRRGHSIRYCTPDAVNNFIREHNLYA
ncbi:Nicotinamide-nucleotide adenylyltransferase [Aphelenchoides besseyi]|nr:Nicotinamide-nucleotide adenylyltransferase [Aphelenchoides besseyi]